MKNGAFAHLEQCSIFHNIFKYMIFQRRQKVLLRSKGLVTFPALTCSMEKSLGLNISQKLVENRP